MWNQSIDISLLELREDAVLIFEQESMQLRFLNQSARRIFGDADGKQYSELIDIPAVERLIRTTIDNGKLGACTLESQPWFAETAVLHTVEVEWDERPAIVLSIDRRAYGAPQEALQLMKAVLRASYFTAIRVDLQTQKASVMISNRPILSTQPTFSSYPDFIRLFAEATIHPEDREQFLACFSVEQLHLFLEAGTSPACSVRRHLEEEYRWASFTLETVNPNIVLLLGKDSNEQHLVKEQSDKFQSELESLSNRNAYILSSVSDIFRLMLHIDLKTGDTVVCSMHPSFQTFFAYDTVYPYESMYRDLMSLTYPDDRNLLTRFSDYTQFHSLTDETENKISFEYRRISRSDPEGNDPKWTRSVINFVNFENGVPTEAFYTVQDIDVERRKELAAKRMRDSLMTQFYTLVQNRFLWFLDYDFSAGAAHCFRIQNHVVQPQMEIPFGQFFERMIMPNCHPEDFKAVAKALLPKAAEEAYREGKTQVLVEYRSRSGSEWKYVRAEMYFQADDTQNLHAMLYISDIDKEVKRAVKASKSEHQQLILRKKFGLTIQDAYVRIGEVDLDADTIQHYSLSEDDYVCVTDPKPFSELCQEFIEKQVHPDHRDTFCKLFSYQQILRAQREHTEKIKHLFLLDVNCDGKYRWCNMVARFFRDEKGKAYLMLYIEDVNDEICHRDAQLHELESVRARLVSAVRTKEQLRIRKAHLFMNIASNFQLALNRIYASLEQLSGELPESERRLPEFREMHQVYEQLSEMTENAKDILLMENNQFPLLREEVNLPALLHRLKEECCADFHGSGLNIIAYSSHVTQEVILGDSRRLSALFRDIFIEIIRAMPAGTNITLQLAQTDTDTKNQNAVYEFSLISSSSNANLQEHLTKPVENQESIDHSINDLFAEFSKRNQHSLYFSKRLISILHGELKFVSLPDNGSAVILRLPFRFMPTQVIFPHMFCFRKRAILMDSRQQYAMATMEIFRETGLQIEWQPDFDNLLSCLRAANAGSDPFSIAVLRQSVLNADSRCCLEILLKQEPELNVILLQDAPPQPHTLYAEGKDRIFTSITPLFRSGLAKTLHEIEEKFTQK